ncbi:MAG: DNA photolyase [Pseudomonadota bacterium]
MKITRLFMDSNIMPSQETDSLIRKIGLKPEPVTDPRTVFDYVNQAHDPVLCGKQTLYITTNQGAVIRKCPGTSHYTCCDYTILHTGTFCTMDCSYCILQAYFHPPVLQYFAGRENMKQELEHLFSQQKIYRIGTGEYTDSLIWERLCDQPEFLVKSFARQNNAILELKTKTVNIHSLKTIDHNQKTVLAWSVNTSRVIASEERDTAPLKARLAAARECEKLGYRIAFHFDPLVIYPGCEAEYMDVISDIFEHVCGSSILWISIGSFRFMPSLKPIIERRFPQSILPYGEFILGLDNKMRYFKPLRMQLYKTIVRGIKAAAPQVMIYFCMEDKEVWEKCCGYFPGREGELGHLLDKRATDLCNLSKF